MQTGDHILFTAPGPDFGTIPTATTEIVGTPGNSLNVYWIVTHFPIGSVLSGPFPQKGSPNVLDNENYILISWLPAPGASSYDLLITEDLQLPKQPGRFLLEANLTETEFRDTGQGLSFYDLAGIPLGAPQEEHIHFNNRDFQQPTLEFIPWPIRVSSIIFEDGSEQNTAGGGGQPAPPDRSVQFNDNGAFAGSPGLTFFQFSNQFELDIGQEPTSIAIAPPFISSGGPINISSFSAQGVQIQAGIGPVVLQPGGGNVGINVGVPQFRLVVAGDINIFDPEAVFGTATFAYRFNGNALTLRADFNNGAVISGQNFLTMLTNSNAGTVYLQGPSADPVNFINVGVRYTDPNGTAIHFGSLASGPEALWIQAYNSSNVVGPPLLLNPLLGNVGIRTLNPQAALDVNGDVVIRDTTGDYVILGGNSISAHPFNYASPPFTISTDFALQFSPGIGPGLQISNLTGDTVLLRVPGSPPGGLSVYTTGMAIGRAQGDVPPTPGNSILGLFNLPTSAAGLLPGDVWNDAGVLSIV